MSQTFVYESKNNSFIQSIYDMIDNGNCYTSHHKEDIFDDYNDYFDFIDHQSKSNTYDISQFKYIMSNEEIVVRNKLNYLLHYSEFLLNYDKFKEMYDLDNESLSIHINLIINKINYIRNILEHIILKELEKDINKNYIQYKMELDIILEIFLENDVYFKDTRIMLEKLNTVLIELYYTK